MCRPPGLGGSGVIPQVRWLTHTGSPSAALRAKTKQPLTPGSINHNTVALPQTAWLPLAPRALARGVGGGGGEGQDRAQASLGSYLKPRICPWSSLSKFSGNSYPRDLNYHPG